MRGLDTHGRSVATLDVSVVIVNWNVRDYLRDCLRSVYEQTKGVRFEVIVVDNGSADGSQEIVRREFPQVRLIENPENHGFAAANNQGIKLATGRYLLLLNPDTVVLDDAIGKAVAFADGNPSVGIVGCQVLETQHSVQPTCFRFPSPMTIFMTLTGLQSLFPNSRLFALARFGDWARDTERDVDVVSGMFMLVRREAIDEVGLMDEDYFMYAEEADWCYRFWQAGWRCVFTPQARITHVDGGSKSTKQVSAQMYVQQQKSLLLFQRKNRGVLAWAITRCVCVIMLFARLCALSVAHLFSVRACSAHKATLAAAGLKYHLFATDSQS